ncbi:hypothetical protein BDN70DRAFT_883256 [Pholiota conissans]|uniref:GLTSCR protein conserved domain-containing protein n=1 Tax=Pholiota conissans TaxID=109636 RepID=A0A9P5YUD0_9AGAR|nr:hypothetical protein BDN70DRAFT_883256 [Pholiota conissans]
MSRGFTGIYNSPLDRNQHLLPAESNGNTSSSSWGAAFSPIWSQSSLGTSKASTSADSVRQLANGNWTPEELAIVAQNLERLNIHIARDQKMVSHPDMDSAFVDEADVVQRLLPYHILQQPKEDLIMLASKGKGREIAWQEEIRTTKMALNFFRRREAIRSRWRKLKVHSGKRMSPDDQAYYLAQVVLDSDRSENAWLGNELRTARTEAERIEREKRATSSTSRTSQFSAAPQAQYYRGYPYAYTQAYGSAITAPTVSTFSVSTAAPSTYAPYQSSSAIPVQLPVASLPALHALGIIPVPAASLPPDGQPQPPAVLRGSTANGTILSLEINVSLLQSAQMSGLAMVLNSLVTRSSASGSNATNVTPTPTKST